MSMSPELVETRVAREPAKQPYSSPLLTRCGTVEELTATPTDTTQTGSGIVSYD